jgi:hypothetical protein
MAQAENTPTPRHQPYAFVWGDDPDHWAGGTWVPLHGPLTRRMNRYTDDRLGETVLLLDEMGVGHRHIGDLIGIYRPGQYLHAVDYPWLNGDPR